MKKYSRPHTQNPQCILCIKDPSLFSVVGWANVVTANCYNKSSIGAPEKLNFARRLVAGEQIDVYGTKFWCNEFPPEISVERIPALCAWEEYREKLDNEQSLLDKAVGGDAKAAIEFCTRLKSGEIKWGAVMG